MKHDMNDITLRENQIYQSSAKSIENIGERDAHSMWSNTDESYGSTDERLPPQKANMPSSLSKMCSFIMQTYKQPPQAKKRTSARNIKRKWRRIM